MNKYIKFESIYLKELKKTIRISKILYYYKDFEYIAFLYYTDVTQRYQPEFGLGC